MAVGLLFVDWMSNRQVTILTVAGRVAYIPAPVSAGRGRWGHRSSSESARVSRVTGCRNRSPAPSGNPAKHLDNFEWMDGGALEMSKFFNTGVNWVHWKMFKFVMLLLYTRHVDFL